MARPRTLHRLHAVGLQRLLAAVCCSAIGWPGDSLAGETHPAGAADVSAPATIRVVDSAGEPVADAVLWYGEGFPAAAPAPEQAVIRQVDKQFVPEVTVVRTGASVEFPNQDAVAHHVYSFAQPNSFEFPLYKSGERPSVRFEHAGIVVLGCNIHDSMLAYVVVVDSPYYSTTDNEGYARFADAPPADVAIHVWSARLDPARPLLAKQAPDVAGQVEVGQRQRADSRPAGGSLAWEDY